MVVLNLIDLLNMLYMYVYYYNYTNLRSKHFLRERIRKVPDANSNSLTVVEIGLVSANLSELRFTIRVLTLTHCSAIYASGYHVGNTNCTAQ